MAATPLPFSVWQDVAALTGSAPAVYSFCMTCREMLADASLLIQSALRTSVKRFAHARRLPEQTLSFETTRISRDRIPAIISGSAVLQIVLGDMWENSDIDIFCTRDATVEVRHHLQTIGCRDVTPEDFDDSKFDLETYGFNLSKKLLNLNLHYHKIDRVFRYVLYRDCCSDTSDSENACCRSDSCSDTPQNIYFDIVQGHADVLDARELLNSFDIKCCAVYFDPARASFHIPEPHLTLRRRSSTEERHASLMSGFANSVREVYHKLGVKSPKAIVSSGTGVHMPDPWWLPCAAAAVRSCEASMELSKVSDTALSQDELTSVYHLCSKLYARQQKYENRGITFENPMPLCSDLNNLFWNRRLRRRLQ